LLQFPLRTASHGQFSILAVRIAAMFRCAARQLGFRQRLFGSNKPIVARGFSSERESSPSSDTDVLVEAVLRAVPVHGWTNRAVSAAVSELGWSPAAAGLLPRGPATAVDALIGRLNRELALHLREDPVDVHAGKRSGPDEPKSTYPPSQGAQRSRRAVYAIRTRMEMVQPWKSSWPQALALQALPQNAAHAVQASAALADEIAHYAGYRAADVSNVATSRVPLNSPTYLRKPCFDQVELSICPPYFCWMLTTWPSILSKLRPIRCGGIWNARSWQVHIMQQSYIGSMIRAKIAGRHGASSREDLTMCINFGKMLLTRQTKLLALQTP
jgi:rpsU-divergently transcribed protein